MTRLRALAALVVVGSLVVGGVFIATRLGFDLIPAEETCTVTVQGHTVTLDPEQAENAATIVAVAVRRGLPPRASSIALATAMQESKLRNIRYGDRDSLGLFQQRPSQGWGTREQILDPVYAAGRFFDALVALDEDYHDLEITVAAQAVQRSAYPDAYAQHEEDARALASALTGETTGGAFHCVVGSEPAAESDRLTDSGLTVRGDRVRREVTAVFPRSSLGGFEPGGVSTGHMEGSAHYEGRAVDVFVRPISAANTARGWVIAQYFVAHAHRLNVRVVIFDDKIWTAGPLSDEGWRDYRVPSSSTGDRDILEHRDHVHIEVFD